MKRTLFSGSFLNPKVSNTGRKILHRTEMEDKLYLTRMKPKSRNFKSNMGFHSFS